MKRKVHLFALAVSVVVFGIALLAYGDHRGGRVKPRSPRGGAHRTMEVPWKDLADEAVRKGADHPLGRPSPFPIDRLAVRRESSRVYSGPDWESIPAETRRAFLASGAADEGAEGRWGIRIGDAEDDLHECPVPDVGPTAAVGSIPHAFDVTDTGNARVSIPIVVPPGVSGMEPALSLVYNSGVGNGLLGMGWSLSGLSSIHRIPKQWGTHGILSPVAWTDSDAFALDGEPVVELPRRGEYRTYRESFAKIEKINPNSELGGFRVWTKDGRILEYGTTDNGRIGTAFEAHGRWHTYALERMQDRFGNTVEYGYWKGVDPSLASGPLEFGIQEIRYAGGSRRVAFAYEDRPDTVEGFRWGMRTNLRRRLRSIETYGPGGRLVRQYRLQYSTDSVTGRSLLTSLQEVPANTLQGKELSFRYTEREGGFGPLPPGFEAKRYTFSDFAEGERGRFATTVVADTDGNGQDDWVSRDVDLDENLSRLAEAMAERPQPFDRDRDGRADLAEVDYFFDSWEGRWRARTEVGDLEGTQAYKPPPPIVADLNGDSDADFVWASLGGRIEYWLRRPPESIPHPQLFDHYVTNLTVPSPLTNRISTLFADVDGDGAVDLVAVDRRERVTRFRWVRFLDAHAPQGDRPERLQWRWLAELAETSLVPLFLDVNGDGLKDLAYWVGGPAPAVALKVCLNMGIGRFAEPYQAFVGDFLEAPGTRAFNTPTIFDLNSDGRDDLLMVTYRTAWGADGDAYGCAYLDDLSHSLVLKSDGRIYVDAYVEIPPYIVDERRSQLLRFAPRMARFVLDGNGDGADDILYFASTGRQLVRWVYPQRSGGTGLLREIQDRTRRTEVEYLPLSDPRVYESSGAAAEWPKNWSGRRRPVVAAVSDYATPATSNLTTYTYRNEQVYPRGGHSLGFERITIREPAREKTTVLEFDTTSSLIAQGFEVFPYAGMPKRVVEWSPISLENRWGFLYRVTRTDFESHVYDYGGVKTYFPHATAESLFLSERYKDTAIGSDEWNRLEEIGNYLTSITTFRYDKDSYVGAPNVVDRTTTVGDFGPEGGPANFRIHRTTTVQYRNQIDHWLIGLVEWRFDSAETHDEPMQTRTTHREYEEGNGRLRTETVEPGDPERELRIHFEEPDRFGHATRVRTHPAVGAERTVHVEYDSDGVFPVRVTNALGHVSRFCYHPGLGALVRKEAPGNLVTTYRVDGFGRVLEEHRPDGTWSRWTYSSDGSHPLILTAADYPSGGEGGGTVSEQYFGYRGWLEESRVLVRDGRMARRRYQYDRYGNLTHESLPSFDEPSQWTIRDYDNLDRPQFVVFPDGRSVAYRYFRLTTRTTHRDGRQTRSVVDPDGRAIRSIDKVGQSTTYRYDGFGNLVEIRDPADNVISQRFDQLGRRWKLMDPDLGTIWYAYDGHGQLTGQLHEGVRTIFRYDALGRRTGAERPEGVAEWIYDRSFVGRLAEKRFGNARTQYDYDAIGRLIRTTATIDGRPFVIDRTYHRFGGLEDLTYPADQAGGRLVVRHEYGALGQPTGVSRPGLSVRWTVNETDAYDRVKRETFGNGLATVREYDPLHGLLTSIRTENFDSIQNVAYGYDPDTLNLRTRDDHAQHSHEEFLYDTLGRLTDWRISGAINVAQSYGYDGLGNMTWNSTLGVMTYRQDHIRPHAVLNLQGQTAVRYDGRGNMTARQGWEMSWTSFNKPSSIRKGRQQPTLLNYDADLIRIQKISDQGTTYYVDGLFEFFQGAGGNSEARHFVAGSDRIVIKIVKKQSGPGARLATDTWYLHEDHLGSTAVMTNAARQVYRTNYQPFGLPFQGQSARGRATTDPGFTGHEHDDELGLINMKGRIYDPVLCRFLSADPVLPKPPELQEINRYSYVLNNPLRYSDPTGHYWEEGVSAHTSTGDGSVAVEVQIGFGGGGPVPSSDDAGRLEPVSEPISETGGGSRRVHAVGYSYVSPGGHTYAPSPYGVSGMALNHSNSIARGGVAVMTATPEEDPYQRLWEERRLEGTRVIAAGEVVRLFHAPFAQEPHPLDSGMGAFQGAMETARLLSPLLDTTREVRWDLFDVTDALEYGVNFWRAHNPLLGIATDLLSWRYSSTLGKAVAWIELGRYWSEFVYDQWGRYVVRPSGITHRTRDQNGETPLMNNALRKAVRDQLDRGIWP